MGLQAIFEKIRASGEAQIAEIERESQAQVRAILAQARMEAHEIEEASYIAESTPANSERARILHRAHLDRLRRIGDVREGLVDTALQRACERLASLRTDPSYPRELRRLTEEALDELDSEGARTAHLLADPRDEELFCGILCDVELETPVSYELDCQGGLIAMSQDSRVVVTNTLESRLEGATPFLRSYLATLFEEEESAIRDVVHA